MPIQYYFVSHFILAFDISSWSLVNLQTSYHDEENEKQQNIETDQHY